MTACKKKNYSVIWHLQDTVLPYKARMMNNLPKQFKSRLNDKKKIIIISCHKKGMNTLKWKMSHCHFRPSVFMYSVSQSNISMKIKKKKILNLKKKNKMFSTHNSEQVWPHIAWRYMPPRYEHYHNMAWPNPPSIRIV